MTATRSGRRWAHLGAALAVSAVTAFITGLTR